MMVDLAFGLNYSGNIIKKPAQERIRKGNLSRLSSVRNLISKFLFKQ